MMDKEDCYTMEIYIDHVTLDAVVDPRQTIHEIFEEMAEIFYKTYFCKSENKVSLN